MNYEYFGRSELINELVKRGYDSLDLEDWGDSELINELNN